MNFPSILAFWQPSAFELMVIMVIALLLFGKRLPDVARSLGKGVVEFKKGLKGIEEDVQKSETENRPIENRPQTYTDNKTATTASTPESQQPQAPRVP